MTSQTHWSSSSWTPRDTKSDGCITWLSLPTSLLSLALSACSLTPVKWRVEQGAPTNQCRPTSGFSFKRIRFLPRIAFPFLDRFDPHFDELLRQGLGKLVQGNGMLFAPCYSPRHLHRILNQRMPENATKSTLVYLRGDSSVRLSDHDGNLTARLSAGRQCRFGA